MKWSELINDKIFSDYDSLRDEVLRWKSFSDKVVFTNGCFDLLHLGHIDYLGKAADQGDRLIVGVNTDT
ncbi:MAG: adenylyltransferase/cytidyltransferase family protein, partial [Bacteroidia bacterium]